MHNIEMTLEKISPEGQVSNAVGFLLYYKNNSEEFLGHRFDDALTRLQNHFPWLQWQWFSFGQSHLLVWSHNTPGDAIVHAPNGDIGLRIGSSPTMCDRQELSQNMAKNAHYHPQWNGKFVFVRLNQQGTDWTISNDWIGSIPVFRAEGGELSVVSTSEPLTVAVMKFTEADMSQRGLVELLHHGHFVASHTLYKQMYFVEPDARSTWHLGRFVSTQTLNAVPISDERWGRSIDSLLEELKPLSENCFKEALDISDSWTIPLSGGLDSRTIAVYAKAFGKDIHAFTYNTAYRNLECGKAVAKALRLKWQQVNVQDNYLNRFTPLWLDWFGTSMHAHGMYHGPLLDRVKELNFPMASGFLGETLYGHNEKPPSDGKYLWIDYMRLCSKSMPLEQVEDLLTFDPRPSIKAITEDLEARFNHLDCYPPYQRNMKFELLARQSHLTTFQSIMYDWWKGVSTPYLNVDFGRFAFSLPEEALEGRILQKRLLMSISPRAAQVPGTFNDDGSPLIHTFSYRLSHKLARSLPEKYRIGSLSMFRNVKFEREREALLKYGASALFPLNDVRASGICSWIKEEKLSELMRQAISQECHKPSLGLNRIQPVIHRLLVDSNF